MNISHKNPRTVPELHSQAIAMSKQKRQKSSLSHEHAVAYVCMVQDELYHQSSCHLESLSMWHSSTLVTNFASAPVFAIAASDFMLNLCASLHLQCSIAAFFNMLQGEMCNGLMQK